MPAGRIVSTVVQTMSSVSHQVATAGEKPCGLWLIYVKTQTVQTCVCLLSAVFSAQPSNYDTETGDHGAAERMPHLLKGGVETRSSEITVRWSPWGTRQGQSFEEKYLAFKKFCFKTCICLRSELRRVQVKCDTLLPSLVLRYVEYLGIYMISLTKQAISWHCFVV